MTTKQTVLTMGKEDFLILHNRILNALFLQSGVQFSEERVLFFCLTSNWYGLNCYIGIVKLVPNLVMACSQKKVRYLTFFVSVFYLKTVEEIYIDCLSHRRKVLHEKRMVGMNLLST